MTKYEGIQTVNFTPEDFDREGKYYLTREKFLAARAQPEEVYDHYTMEPDGQWRKHHKLAAKGDMVIWRRFGMSQRVFQFQLLPKTMFRALYAPYKKMPKGQWIVSGVVRGIVLDQMMEVVAGPVQEMAVQGAFLYKPETGTPQLLGPDEFFENYVTVPCNHQGTLAKELTGRNKSRGALPNYDFNHPDTWRLFDRAFNNAIFHLNNPGRGIKR